MANALYTKYKQTMLSAGGIDLLEDNILVVLVNFGAYTPNLATDQFLSDIPAGARIATSEFLSGKTVAAGVFDAEDVVMASVSGPQSEALVFYKDAGSPSASPLLLILDTSTGLPITPNGADITITWDNGENKIFKLN